jgi:hypothetical protein
LPDDVVKEIIADCNAGKCGGGVSYVAPPGDIIQVPLVQPPSTVVIIPWSGYYGY